MDDEEETEEQRVAEIDLAAIEELREDFTAIMAGIVQSYGDDQ